MGGGKLLLYIKFFILKIAQLFALPVLCFMELQRVMRFFVVDGKKRTHIDCGICHYCSHGSVSRF